ncbi:MAG: hypothetical protein K5Q00_03165 [Gammaproteobacteria bacterium]|nr:hypothetical protein [Gammaproteobacteria bacterium]
MKFKIDELMAAIEKWLLTGEINPGILAEEFTFTSPFWKQADRQAFIDKFLDPKDYIEAALSRITHIDPVVQLKSHDDKYFTIVLTYHTKNRHSVTEAVFCRVANGLLTSMQSIYDLEETKAALELN